VLTRRRLACDRRAREGERRLERLDPAAQRFGQNAADLRQRAVRPVGIAERKAARGGQAQHDSCRLVLGQHQRWQAIPGAKPIAAAHATFAFDRDPEPLQRGDVAPHCAPVDVQPVAELTSGHQRFRLEDFEQLEQA
jgi:hypothetical protein